MPNLDLISLLIIFVVYYLTNVIKGMFRLTGDAARGCALLLGVLLNALRTVSSGVTFPAGFSTLFEAVLFGIAFGVLAMASHFIEKIAAQFGLPLYGAEDSEQSAELVEPEGPTIVPAPPVTHDGPDPALASTPERTENPV